MLCQFYVCHFIFIRWDFSSFFFWRKLPTLHVINRFEIVTKSLPSLSHSLNLFEKSNISFVTFHDIYIVGWNRENSIRLAFGKCWYIIHYLLGNSLQRVIFSNNTILMNFSCQRMNAANKQLGDSKFLNEFIQFSKWVFCVKTNNNDPLGLS